MEVLQITYKLKKGRQSLVAIVGRGSSRFELGTGLKLPVGVLFSPPMNVHSGGHEERNRFIGDLVMWDASIRDKWRRHQVTNPMADRSDFMSVMSKSRVKPINACVSTSLRGWVDEFAKRNEDGVLVNMKSGSILSPDTVAGNKYFVTVMRRLLARYGDFEFANLDPSTTAGGKQDQTGRFVSFGFKTKHFLLEECHFGYETTFKIMEKLRRLIRNSSKEYLVPIDSELLGVFRYPRPTRSNNEDIVALEIDQFEWIMDNEQKLRLEATSGSQKIALDYLIIGLLTCARKGDMNSWSRANLTSKGQEMALRYIPNKTKGSSAVKIEIFPLPEMVKLIFTRNLGLWGKLMPPISGSIGRSLRSILKRHEIFHRETTVRTPKGDLTTKKAYEALKIHSLRASGISYLLCSGVPEMVVKRISGHTLNSESFGVYVKVLDDQRSSSLRSILKRFT